MSLSNPYIILHIFVVNVQYVHHLGAQACYICFQLLLHYNHIETLQTRSSLLHVTLFYEHVLRCFQPYIPSSAEVLTHCVIALRWRHNDHDSVSNHQPHGCLLNRFFGRRSKKTSKFRVTGLCVGNSPGPDIWRYMLQILSPHQQNVVSFALHIKMLPRGINLRMIFKWLPILIWFVKCLKDGKVHLVPVGFVCYVVLSSNTSMGWCKKDVTPGAHRHAPCGHLAQWGRMTHLRQYTKPPLVQIMACHLLGAEPLSEPMLEYN